MTIEEIFGKLVNHMRTGVAFHDGMAQACGFLGLQGYSLNQYKHEEEELKGYIQFYSYVLEHCHKLIKLDDIPKLELIPETWYKYNTLAVDTNTKREAVKTLLKAWIEWERSTKKLYSEMRSELCSINEIATALFLDQYIEDVSYELLDAEKKLIKLESLNYDISTIIEEQDWLCKHYMKNNS